ncbi:sushi, von Willebrand factor type A, EGF and pentraxin domain-containing protein 1-like [Ruditapes philippinarum]|uniref:sushi, von Willebrand factor type A, EGF and pentraxin domain-containing protein 1-like n=1 Tax=Ruditapes philippinarum TaxID=129788 RepID=UPI00295B4A0E|nr:sushi, von Willebrand factor type A, EGF and pentraxin domain-containing protein 1-like [Ruditapes philippinarum]
MEFFMCNIIFWILNICFIDCILATTIQDFHLKRENLNKRLVSCTFLELTVQSHHDCARACFGFGGSCKSINFNKKSKTCELNAKGVDTAEDSEFEDSGGYIFSDMTEWPKLMTSGCSQENCGDHQFCRPLGKHDFQCADKANCGEAPSIDNGSVSAPVTIDGATASYTCDFGFENLGTFTTRQCVEGTWSKESITCTIKECGPLANIAHGTVSAASTTHGSTATYSCQYGYERTSGDITRNCVDGTWDGIEMTCTIKEPFTTIRPFILPSLW